MEHSNTQEMCDALCVTIEHSLTILVGSLVVVNALTALLSGRF
jgi:threonine aldolase